MTAPEATVALSASGVRLPGGRRKLERDLRRLAAYAAGRAERAVHLSFALVDDAAIRAANRDHLGHDYATDVLAFPMAQEPALEGELMISVETARREADRRGHPAYHEIVLYAVHGVMHLLGHDDHGAAPRRRMRRAERSALAALGIPAVFGRKRTDGGAACGPQ